MVEDLKRICVIFAPLEVILSIPNGPVLKWSRSDFVEILRRLQFGSQAGDAFFVPLPAAQNGLIDQQWTMLNQHQYGPKRGIDDGSRILDNKDENS